MGFNKKVLSKAVSELDKAKAPAKPRDITVDPMGYWNPANQGQPVRVPGGDDINGMDITMHKVNQPIWAQPNVGPGAIMYPEENRNFKGASYVDETPIGRKGGTLKSHRYSKSMSATNKLFTKNKLFQNKKSKIFDPNAKFKSGGSKLGPINLNPNPLSHYELNYGFNLPTKQEGGENEDEYMDLTDEEIQTYRDGGYVVEELPEAQDGGPQNTSGPRAEEIPTDVDAMNAMMKARIATDAEFGNPAAQRMTSPNPKTYDFGNGNLGTHFMASMGNQAVPLLQDKGGDELEYNENPPPSKEDMNFRNPEEAQYFAEHYKEVAPMMKGFKQGGYVQHEIAKAQKGGTRKDNYQINPETFNYEGRPGARYRKDNSGNWLVADKSTDGKFVAVKDSTGKRQAELNKKAISSETGKNVYVPKNAQKRFEQELWNDYDKLSMPEKALDRVQAGMTDPLGMTSRFLTGKQAYIPGMGKGLLNTDSENYEKYLKSVGYTPGKFEVSDVQNLLNPMNWSASAGNQLAKGNVGQGLLETGLALAGTGQSKNIMKGAKYLMDDITKGSKTLKNVSLPKYKNVYRVEPTSFTKDPKDAMSGRWIGTQEEMPFYIRNLKDPEAGIRIMRQKMPVKKWEALSGHNMPEEAKLMSAGTGDYKTFNDAINAGELSSGAGKRLSKNVPLTSDMQELSNNPRLINLQEGIISDELANKLRYKKPRKYFSNRDLVEYPSGDLGKKGAIDHIFTVNKDVEKPILGIPRQYLPFKDGGVTEAWEDELDEDEIEELRRGGYVVEDLD
jgi:hypothetical protein